MGALWCRFILYYLNQGDSASGASSESVLCCYPYCHHVLYLLSHRDCMCGIFSHRIIYACIRFGLMRETECTIYDTFWTEVAVASPNLILSKPDNEHVPRRRHLEEELQGLVMDGRVILFPLTFPKLGAAYFSKTRSRTYLTSINKQIISNQLQKRANKFTEP